MGKKKSEEDTDLSGIRVWCWRFSIHKLGAKFRYVAGTIISPAAIAIRLLLRNHGAAVARRRRGASSALSFSHLERMKS